MLSRSLNVPMHMLDYFRVPFPSRQGFSAYRFPGLAAHLPFFLVFAVSDLLLCGRGPLLVIWLVAGLYLGRDVAVTCHYAPPLLLVIWAVMFTVLTEAKAITAFAHSHPAAGIGLTIVVLVLQVYVAWRSTAWSGQPQF